VATEEIRFGDNDTLAALVTNLLQADLLIILTDVSGLMDADPRVHPQAQRIKVADAYDPALDSMPGAGSGELGRGGMVTKLKAARLAARSGAHTVIASGHQANVLLACVNGDDVGTRLTSSHSPLAARKHWLAGQLRAKGDLHLDSGAARALTERGVSLLAVGLTGVSGSFQRGDLVRCLDPQGKVIAQGLCNYGSTDVVKLVGVQSDAFARHIDFVGEPELVHRDNLVIL
ncbi:MAG: glutamate 5-kinase, partial [Pseudomonadota bacterium]